MMNAPNSSVIMIFRIKICLPSFGSQYGASSTYDGLCFALHFGWSAVYHHRVISRWICLFFAAIL